jgi:hypothetical protein
LRCRLLQFPLKPFKIPSLGKLIFLLGKRIKKGVVMTKKSIVFLGVVFSLGLFLAAIGSSFAFPDPGRAGEPQRFPGTQDSLIHKIGGGIFVSANLMRAGVYIESENGLHVSDALVVLNDRILACGAGSLYSSDIQYSCGAGTQLQLRIWLKKAGTPFPLKSVPSYEPDYAANGTIAGWLTPVFPVPGSTVNLAKAPAPTFRWSVAGAMGRTCWSLEAPPAPQKFCMNCGPQLAVTIPAGTLAANENYKLTLENFYFFSFTSKKNLTINSQVSIIQTEIIAFNTI